MYRFKGTDKEFEILVNQNKAAVYGTVLAYLKGNSDADDVVWETFMTAYLNYGKIRDTQKIGAWLCGVARNIALKKLRKSLFELPLEDWEHINTDGVEDEYCMNETSKEIFLAIDKLSKPVAETISLFYFAGKTVKEISSLIGVSEGTVKGRLHDGRKKLKGEFIDMMKDRNKAIENNNVYAEIKGLIEKAKNERENNNSSAAIIMIDSAIEKFEAVEKDFGLMAEIYRQRAYEHSRIENAREDGEKSVAYSKLTGDKRKIAQCLLSYAFDLNGEKAINTFKEAYETANNVGYFEICAESAFWIAAQFISLFQYDDAKKWLEVALENYEKIRSYRGVDCCEGDSLRVSSLAKACLDSMAMLESVGRLNGEYSTLVAYTQLIRNDTDELITGNSYGWDIAGKHQRIENSGRFYNSFELEWFLCPNKLLENGVLDYEYYLYNGVVINRHYEVISYDETVITDAGNFSNCVHVKITETIPNFDIENEQHKEASEYLDSGEHWYCKNIGLVKSYKKYENCGECEPYIRELKAYSVNNQDDSKYLYFPISKGNTWEYSVKDMNGKDFSSKYNYKEKYFVDTITDKYIYLSNSGYIFDLK